MDTTEFHYWYPVAGDRRHAFKGARQWTGERSGTTVCDIEVALAGASEMDWIYLRTCNSCWDILVAER